MNLIYIIVGIAYHPVINCIAPICCVLWLLKHTFSFLLLVIPISQNITIMSCLPPTFDLSNLISLFYNNEKHTAGERKSTLRMPCQHKIRRVFMTMFYSIMSILFSDIVICNRYLSCVYYKTVKSTSTRIIESSIHFILTCIL